MVNQVTLNIDKQSYNIMNIKEHRYFILFCQLDDYKFKYSIKIIKNNINIY